MKSSIALISTGLVALALLVAATAQANAPRVTRGDAQAILETLPNGGWSVVLHDGSAQGAPADFLPGSTARIAPVDAWDGSHFCSLDWHVISLNLIDGNAEGESRTNAEIRELLSQSDLVFMLDAAPLETRRTPIKRFLNPGRFGLVEAYAIGEGQVLAPEELAVGRHSLQATIFWPGEPPDVMPAITFFVDAPGDGACLS